MSLLVKLGWDGKPVTRGTNKARREIKTMERSFTSSFSTVKGAAQNLLGGLALGRLRAFTGEVATLSHEARTLGVSAEFLQKFRAAATDASGRIGEASVGKGLKAVNVAALDAEHGIGLAKDAFERLGVNVRDQNGGLASTEDLLFQIAKGFEDVASRTERNALAAKIFGARNIELVNILDDLQGRLDKIGNSEIFTNAEVQAGEVLDERIARGERQIKGVLGKGFKNLGFAEAVFKDVNAVGLLETLFGDKKFMEEARNFADHNSDQAVNNALIRRRAGEEEKARLEAAARREVELEKKRMDALKDVLTLREKIKEGNTALLTDEEKLLELIWERNAASQAQMMAELDSKDGTTRAAHEVLALEKEIHTQTLKRWEIEKEIASVEENIARARKSADDDHQAAIDKQNKAKEEERQKAARAIEEEISKAERRLETLKDRSRGPELDALTAIGLGPGGVNFDLDNSAIVNEQKAAVEELKGLREDLHNLDVGFDAPTFGG